MNEWESEMEGQTLDVSKKNWKCVRNIEKKKFVSILKFDGVKNKWNVCFLTDWLIDWLTDESEIKVGTIKSYASSLWANRIWWDERW